ncbi:hypothetical protein KGQ24_02680 [Patescibacteria group bacterium]|nr:hypothetical protein [Patescibacteria group bacterium]
MKKIFLAALIGLAAASCNQAQNQNTAQNTGQTQQQLQTYKNGTYNFEFQYPADLTFVTPIYASLEDKIVQVQIPQSAYPKTNFGDAAFSVSAQYAANLQDCLKLNAPENADKFSTKVTINGIDFYMSQGTGAGAGNYYESRVYRALSSGHMCVELNETLHTSNIYNYPPNTVTEVDKNAVWARLNQILNTFKFTASQ